MLHPSPFTEGAFRRRSVAERGWRRLQARFAPSSQEARSPSAPDEGAALSGWDSSDEGRRKCRLDNVSGLSPSVRRRSTVAVSKIAAVERRKARLLLARGRRGAFQKVPLCSAPFRRSASLRGGNKDPGESPETGQDGLTVRRHAPRGAGRARPFHRNGADE